MIALHSNLRTSLLRIGAATAVVAMLLALGGGCELLGKEGDRCNALVQQDECNAGLHCKLATCSEAYCCPTDRSSSDPNCNTVGCPAETDGGEEGGGDAAETGTDSGASEGGNEAADVGEDASDGGDSG
jgi:hypothetical protein